MPAILELSTEEEELMRAYFVARNDEEEVERILYTKRLAREQAQLNLLAYIQRRYRVIHPRGSTQND